MPEILIKWNFKILKQSLYLSSFYLIVAMDVHCGNQCKKTRQPIKIVSQTIPIPTCAGHQAAVVLLVGDHPGVLEHHVRGRGALQPARLALRVPP